MEDKGPSQEVNPHRYAVFIGIGIVLVILLVALSVLLPRGLIKAPSSVNTALSVTPTPSVESSIDLKTKYDNPFDKNSQYVNPFSGQKNPFDNLQ